MPRSAAKPDPAASASAEPASYEAAVVELEDLVARMEGGQMPLDQLLEAYRRGAELLNYCRHRLTVVENQVKLLDDGVLKDWPAA